MGRVGAVAIAWTQSAVARARSLPAVGGHVSAISAGPEASRRNPGLHRCARDGSEDDRDEGSTADAPWRGAGSIAVVVALQFELDRLQPPAACVDVRDQQLAEPRRQVRGEPVQ